MTRSSCPLECATETICAPYYTNIFTGKFGKTYIYLYINLFLNFHCRFIDDTFSLWNGTAIRLQEFIKNLNNRHPSIKFDFKFSKTSISSFRRISIQKQRLK